MKINKNAIFLRLPGNTEHYLAALLGMALTLLYSATILPAQESYSPGYGQSSGYESSQFPYTAYITTDDVYIRSGPGKDFYPTSKLGKGDPVEIYRHDPGGWYAIRPTEKSFSWVSGRYLRLIDDQLAVVTDDRVAARVGCEMSDVRDVIQIRLLKGQKVKVLGQKRFGTGDSSMWYQIAPPPGEFRWVFGRYVDPDYMTSGVRDASRDGRPNVLAEESDSTTTPTQAAQSVAARSDLPDSRIPTESVTDPGVHPAYYNAHQNDGSEKELVQTADHWAPVGVSEGASDSMVRPASVQQASSPSTLPTTDDSLQNQGQPSYLDEQLGNIRVELALMLAEEPTVWYFDEMEQDVRQLLAQAETAIERGRIRLVLDSILRSRQIKQKYEQLNELQRSTSQTNRQLQLLEQTVDANPGSPYDASGYLVRLEGAKLGQPPYALVDQQGHQTCFVTPAPGTNLEGYVGRPVGFFGTRATYGAQKFRHIFVQQTVLLNQNTLYQR